MHHPRLHLRQAHQRKTLATSTSTATVGTDCTTSGATGTLTRNVDGLDGNLTATTTKTGGVILQLANLHGDIALQLPADSSAAPTVLDYDEYGNPRTDQPATRYGWVGGKQRSSETPTGLILMGVRLYNPGTGRFLSTDPVPGGSANAYEYCNGDPINTSTWTGAPGVSRASCGGTAACSRWRTMSLL